jgi:lipocalin
MSSIKNLRNDLDNVLQSKQSLMSIKRYNGYWYDIAEHWDNKEELNKIYAKINKIKQSKVSTLKQELKALRDAGMSNLTFNCFKLSLNYKYN